MIFYTATEEVSIKKHVHGIYQQVGSWFIPRFYFLPKWSFTRDGKYGDVYWGFSEWEIRRRSPQMISTKNFMATLQKGDKE